MFRCSRLAGNWLTNVPKSIRLALKHLKPIIEERQGKIDEYGSDYPDKPVRAHYGIRSMEF
jgi:hypothetical protein